MLTVILTGGQSSRMGRDKALLPLQHKTMSEALVQRYQRAFGEVAVSVNVKGRFPSGGARELVDAFPGIGPLNGLYSAFTQTDAELVFLTATDLPNGDPRLVQFLRNCIVKHDACVIQRADGNLEPLFALYRRTCLPYVQENLKLGRRSLHNILHKIDTRFIPEEELLMEFDLNTILLNLNTPTDYEAFCSGS